MRNASDAKPNGDRESGRLYLQTHIKKGQSFHTSDPKHQSIAQEHKAIDHDVENVETEENKEETLNENSTETNEESSNE